MLKSIRAAHHTKKPWKQELYAFLRMYRCTVHCTTGFSPYHLMFSRPARTKLPQIEQIDDMYDKVNQYDTQRKETMKTYADKRHNAKVSNIEVGDRVYVKQRKENKWSTPYGHKTYTVISRKGNMISACDDDRNYITRNVSFFKKVNMYTCRVGNPNQNGTPGIPAEHINTPTRPQRIKRPSVLLKDYVCNQFNSGAN